MLIAKGSRVHLYLEGGRKVSPAGFLLHDESGRDFPAKRCLITSISKGKTPLRKTKWFGPKYQPLEGTIDIPGARGVLIRTSSWDDLGTVSKIEYDRVGEHAAAYTHKFVDPKPILLRRGRVYCLALRGATKLNWRGFVEKNQ